MGHGFANGMDNLAANGILNFDANAFVMGTQPRYVGNPYGESLSLPFDRPLPAYPSYSGHVAHLPEQPHHDTFVSNHSEHKSNVPWKKILLGGILATVAIVGGYKGVKYIKGGNWKNIPTTIQTTATKWFTDGKKAATDAFNNAWPKIQALPSKIFKKAPATPTPPAATT